MRQPERGQTRRRQAYTGETMVQHPPQPRNALLETAQRRQFRRRLRLTLLVVLLLVLLIAGGFYWQVRSVAQEVVVPDVRPNPSLASPLLGGANILLIGVDERGGNLQEGVRSDTLILLHLDAGGRWASLLSIPRDTQVEVPGLGAAKINAAYYQGYLRAEELFGAGTTPQQGGMALAAQTVEDFLGLRERGLGGLRVDYTAQVNFEGFAGLIDALGGIRIDVPKLIIDEEYPTENFGVTRIEFQPGPQTMDGATALIYARTRHADSDFGRAERQQQVLRAIVAELQQRGWAGRVSAVPGLLRSVRGTEDDSAPLLTTFPVDRPDVLLGILSLAAGMDPADINQVRISPEFVGVSQVGTNLLWDPAGINERVDTFLTRPSEAREAATVQVFNGTGVSGLAGTMTGELEQVGFAVTVAADAPPGDYPQTIVYDRHNKPLTSRRLARRIDAEVIAAEPPPGLVSSADIVVVIGADRASQ
jgi:polyisoprenyl-teichoic acid--peptidoglycan teichoic acid transferase